MCILLFGSAVFEAQAAFSSLYAFGDGVCTTTNNTGGGSLYYGKRYTNGRVWIEVLAQRQGLNYESNKNWSYFGDYSSDLIANVNRFTAPPDANTALFVVWVNDADFVADITSRGPGQPEDMNLAVWTAANNQSLTNHFNIITSLYAKGARTLVMPNAVDITKIPEYNGLSTSEKAFIRQRVIDFNTGFASVLNQVKVLHPDLTIYEPDIFSLVDNMVANPANYGLIKPTTDAIDDHCTDIKGRGTNYVFWDYMDPTAMVHLLIADVAQQLVSPPRINGITSFGGSNRLDIANVPIGRDGFVAGTTNLVTWSVTNSFTSVNATQSIFVPANGPQGFYRLCFPPAVWTWP